MIPTEPDSPKLPSSAQNSTQSDQVLPNNDVTKSITKWIHGVLSPLFRCDEITETEWTLFTQSTLLCGLVEQHCPNAKVSKKTMESQKTPESQNLIRETFRRVNQICRAVSYAYRKTSLLDPLDLTFLTEFQKGLGVQENPRYILLIRSVYETSSLQLTQSLFVALYNPILLEALLETSSFQKTPKEIVQIVLNLLLEPRFVDKFLGHDETNTFKNLLVPYIQMAQFISFPNLYLALLPVLHFQLTSWSPTIVEDDSTVLPGPTFVITLKEPLLHKIRKDTALSINIHLPQTISLSYDPTSATIHFLTNFPTCYIARGGIYMGALKSMRALTDKEIKAQGMDERKQLECVVTPGFGVHWALKLLGGGSSFYLANSTLWWYFRKLKEEEEKEQVEEQIPQENW